MNEPQLSEPLLQLAGEPLGEGQERVCYAYPGRQDRLVKLQKGHESKQTRRELALYARLSQQGMVDFGHIPRFYGEVDTNLGRGFIVDCIRDFDGQISRSLWWHFEHGYPVSEFSGYLAELRRYLLANCVVFSVDMGRYNILFQRRTPQQARLVVIDGLGNHTAFNWLDRFGYFARRKIERRWRRFSQRLQHYSELSMQAHQGAPRVLEAAYQRREAMT